MAGMLRRLFGRSERDALVPLYQAVISEARRPIWYRDGRVPDTFDGRFDMVAAVMSLLLLRLETEGDAMRAASAHLTELFVEDMDGQLRERGIGDIIVGKHIGRMMAALGGRLGAFRDGLRTGELDSVIERNIYRGVAVPAEASALVRESLAKLHGDLAQTAASSLIAGEWPR